MNYTILIIEDNKDMRINIAEILQLANYNVVCAENGKIGIELAKQKKPDLILCDIMMPELDGYGVIHILNKDPDLSGTPFIFITAKVDKADIRTGMDLGADDYLTKPFEGSELLKVIETRLRKHALIKSSVNKEIKDFLTNISRPEDAYKFAEPQHYRTVSKKNFLFMEGSAAIELYYIQSGKIKTYKTSREGKELLTGIHQPGQFIGFLPLLENTPQQETAIALEDSKIYVIAKDNFLSVLFSDKKLFKQFIRLLADNLSESETRLLEMAYQSVRQRVAGVLLKIVEKYGDSSELITLSRKDISGIVGTATESLNRTLADFKEEGLIELTGSGIRICNLKKMKQAAR